MHENFEGLYTTNSSKCCFACLKNLRKYPILREKYACSSSLTPTSEPLLVSRKSFSAETILPKIASEFQLKLFRLKIFSATTYRFFTCSVPLMMSLSKILKITWILRMRAWHGLWSNLTQHPGVAYRLVYLFTNMLQNKDTNDITNLECFIRPRAFEFAFFGQLLDSILAIDTAVWQHKRLVLLI